MTKSERIESIILMMVGFVAAAAWYNYWVAPQDELRFAIMECMGDDHGRAAYDICYNMISSK